MSEDRGAAEAPQRPRGGNGHRPLPAPEVVAIIVNYGTADRIERLLTGGSLRGARVLLVDNASEPERIRELAVLHGADVLLLDRNHGFAGGVNRAVGRVPEGAQVLLLNPDVELTPAVLPRLRQELSARDVTGVSPVLVDPDGTIQVGTAGGPVRSSAFALYFLFGSHLAPSLRGIFFTRRQLSSGAEPAWLCMACLLLEPEAVRRLGPLPEHELVYAEDVAWGWAASKAGARFAVVPEVTVVHEQGSSGAGDRWRGALARLAMRECGPWRGGVAVACMSVGLAVRRRARAWGARPRR